MIIYIFSGYSYKINNINTMQIRYIPDLLIIFFIVGLIVKWSYEKIKLKRNNKRLLSQIIILIIIEVFVILN